jgi:ABC-type antimicrobial peptide transport system permease subunit
VVDRAKDFAVRLALGSEPGGVMRLVLGESIRDLAIGILAGVAAGTALCALLARSLENVASVDAITTGSAIAIISAAGLTAALVPALRLLRVHPAQVLRS